MLMIGVPVLRRYDLLRELVASLGRSTLKPNYLAIIDNGQQPDKARVISEEATRLGIFTDVICPNKPMGVAESWNFFIKNYEGLRIISNDDIEFGPRSLEKFTANQADLVFCDAGFSCFLLRDSGINKVAQYDRQNNQTTVGLFDESISPGYGYYEDEDYMTRLLHARAWMENVQCGVVHKQSQTINAANAEELQEHHRKFITAQSNFIKKWGGMPGPAKAAAEAAIRSDKERFVV
jgi:hypothetical protein